MTNTRDAFLPRVSGACRGRRLLRATMNGEAVDLDLKDASGGYGVSWLGPSSALQGSASAVTGGHVVTLTPPQTGT